MKTRTEQSLILFSVLLTFVMLAPYRALADDDDPPSRVARLSFIRGQVSFSPAGTDDWVSAVLNRPLTTGDKLWTDQDGRAELHVGSATIRLGDQAGFNFLNLDDRIMQLSLTEGTLNLRVRRMGQDESIEIDTPNLALSVLRPGRYRITVNEAGDTTSINVRDGEGEVTGGGSAYTVHPGEQGFFTGNDTLSADIEPLPELDSFDTWCDERDLREDHSVARRYVSEDVIGYEDLDEHGGWRTVPEYGTVWFPHVTVVGWAPYRYGHWVWISPWGWTWVDDAPWGFAPFHYGRWVFVGGGWGWVPCPPPVVAVAYVRPVYAPALVAWVGGPHFAAGVAFGGGGYGAEVNVGWFPLGPREVYVPSYRVSRTYVNNVNISNTTVNQTVINNYYNNTIVNKNVTVNNVTYLNQRVPGAVTATSHHAFSSAQPVGRNMVVVNQREMVAAPVIVHAPAVVPPKEAVLGAGAVSHVHPPTMIQTRAVVAKTAPPPPPPSFAVRQAAIEKNQGRPLSISETRQLQAPQAHNNVVPVRMAPPANPGTPRVHNVQQGGYKGTAGPGPMNTIHPPNNSGQPNTQVNQANRPANPQTNTPANPSANTHGYSDRPPTSRPVTPVNPQLEQKHQQQIEQLQQKQDQQYQKLQQKQNQQQRIQQPKVEPQREQQIQQNQEQQKIQQQNIDQQKEQQVQQQQRQIQQKQQQQLEQLQQKQTQQQQVLRQKQEAEHAKAYKEPPKEQPKSTDKKHDEKEHH